MIPFFISLGTCSHRLPIFAFCVCAVHMLDVCYLFPHNVADAPSFTSRGFKYYHLFNMKLCGDKYEEAVCSSNISLSTGQSVSNILADESEL